MKVLRLPKEKRAWKGKWFYTHFLVFEDRLLAVALQMGNFWVDESTTRLNGADLASSATPGMDSAAALEMRG